jgi:transposase
MLKTLEQTRDMPDLVQRQAQIIDDLETQIALQKEQLLLLNEQLTWLKKQVFGAKSERIVADLGQQSLPFAEMVTEVQSELAVEEISYQRRKSARNKGKDSIRYPDDLPVKRVELDVPKEQKVCVKTGEPLTRIGEEVSRKLARRTEQFYIIEYVRPKYASRKHPDQGILTAPLPDAVIARCPADESLLASVLVAKYCDHLPLYRQVQMLRRSDVQISRQTLSKWVLSLAAGLKPLYEAMKARVLQSGVIFVDESPVNLQSEKKGPCKKAYMWIYVGGGGGDPPYRFFEFRISRSHAHVEQTLEDYTGVMHSDKYAAYEKLAKRETIQWCPCLAHVRRKFVEAEYGDPALRSQILKKIRYLFLFERVVLARSAEERLKIRQEKEKPILESLTALVKERIHQGGLLPKSKFTQALHYYLGLAPHFSNYLENAEARLDNNVAERAIRPLTIGRKNWMFVGSENGGQAAATILSLVQTCRHLNINPQDYLEDVLRRIMGHPASRIEELLPDQWQTARQQNIGDLSVMEDGLG